MLPTLLSSTAEAVQDFSAELALSRFESVLMLLCYGLFLVFQLVTHRWADMAQVRSAVRFVWSLWIYLGCCSCKPTLHKCFWLGTAGVC
jgi:hypothetical protein